MLQTKQAERRFWLLEDVMDNISKAADVLFNEMGVENVRFSINPKSTMSANERAEQVLRVLEDLKTGNFEVDRKSVV